MTAMRTFIDSTFCPVHRSARRLLLLLAPLLLAPLRLAPLLLACAAGFAGCGRNGVEPASSPGGTKAEVKQEKSAPAKVASVSTLAFREAALQGQIETVRRAIAQGVDVDAADEDGRTALQLAAFDGHTQVVQALLDEQPTIDHVDASGRTALMYAASGANRQTVELLLKSGADADVVDNVEHFTALMFAAAEGQREVVQVLLEHGADTTLKDTDGDSALDFALQNGHREVAALLQSPPK